MRASLLFVSALTLAIGGGGFWLGPSLSTRCGGNPQLDMGALAPMLIMYRYDTGRFPTSAEGLQALVNRPVGAPMGWRKLLDEVPRDPWGNPFVYRFPTPEDPERFDLLSLGPDGVPSADDVHYRWRVPAIPPTLRWGERLLRATMVRATRPRRSKASLSYSR